MMRKTCTPPSPPPFWLSASGKLVSMVHSLIVTSAAFRRPLGITVRSYAPEAFCYPKRNWKIEEYVM